MEPTNVHRVIVGIFWQDRRRVGPVAKHVTAPSDPVEAAARVKDLARKSGAALVGITELTEELRYEGFDTPFKYAISIAIPMDRDEMVHAPSNRACLSIMHTYKDVNRVAIEVAEAIRVWGWPAHASTNLSPDAAEVLHVPTAIQAGLGQLGKHGSLITPEYGSNVRLVSVLTDIPLAVDAPRDPGVDDFCATCRVGASNAGTSISTNAPPTSRRTTVAASASRFVRGANPAEASSSPRGCFDAAPRIPRSRQRTLRERPVGGRETQKSIALIQIKHDPPRAAMNMTAPAGLPG